MGSPVCSAQGFFCRTHGLSQYNDTWTPYQGQKPPNSQAHSKRQQPTRSGACGFVFTMLGKEGSGNEVNNSPFSHCANQPTKHLPSQKESTQETTFIAREIFFNTLPTNFLFFLENQHNTHLSLQVKSSLGLTHCKNSTGSMPSPSHFLLKWYYTIKVLSTVQLFVNTTLLETTQILLWTPSQELREAGNKEHQQEGTGWGKQNGPYVILCHSHIPMA